VAVAGACKKDKTKPPPSPTAPTSTAEQDALWALVPDNAVGGIIITPGALQRVDAAAAAIDKLFAAAPDLAPFKAKMEQAFEDAFGTKTFSLAAAGLTAKQGFAAFGVDNNEAGIAIFPVADRDKFLADEGRRWRRYDQDRDLQDRQEPLRLHEDAGTVRPPRQGQPRRHPEARRRAWRHRVRWDVPHAEGADHRRSRRAARQR
jgi:hypothetical protein